MTVKYPVHSINRLRINTDGEGIRTLILLSGCPLRCKYCINSSTWDGTEQSIMMTSAEVYSKIIVDRSYILATNGGITFGGGEPLIHPSLINEVRNIIDKGMTIFVETSLNIPWDDIYLSQNSIDRYYIDIKTTDPEKYKYYTGMELAPVIDNLRKLIELKSKNNVIVRIPEIPGLVNINEQFESKKYLYDIGVELFDLFKYQIH